MNIRKIKYFLLVGMWKEENKKRKGILGRSINWLRKLWLAIVFFIRRGHSDYATALSFSTLLAIVPVFAVVFAIARGFDLSIYIEVWFRDLMSSQPQVAESVIKLANSYLVHAKSGVIIGIGLIFMLFSVLSLIYNVEHALDQIWQVEDNRSPMRILIDYTALLFLVPIIIIIISGLNIFLTRIVCGIGYDVEVLSQADSLYSDALLLHRLLCRHAQYEGTCVESNRTRHHRWSSDDYPAVCLYPRTNLADQLQRHLWLVCCPAAVYAVGTHLVVHLSVLRRVVLYEPEHGLLRVPHRDERRELRQPDADERHAVEFDLSPFC